MYTTQCLIFYFLFIALLLVLLTLLHVRLLCAFYYILNTQYIRY